MDLRFYLSLFWRRVHWFLLFVVIGTGVGVTLAQVWPTTYVARARLLVESEQIPGELAASTVQTETTEQLQIIQQRILTRATLIDMANRLDVYGQQPGQEALSADGIVADMRRRIEIVTSGGAGPRGRGPVQATLMSVSFAAPDAMLASTVANELVTLILREDIEMRTGVARQTLDFFEQEVARLDQELAKRSQVILEFKEENQRSLPDSLDFRREQRSILQERLITLGELETDLVEQRKRAIRVHESVNDTPSAAIAQEAGIPEKQQLEVLLEERRNLSSDSPRAKELDAEIEALEIAVARQRPTAPRNAFEMQLIEIADQLDQVQEQRTEIGNELEVLEQSIIATPSNAITLDTLERDYANVRVQYDQAVANKARAETGDMIEALSKGERISVIEQAVAPRAPEQPNRPLLAAGGVGGGIVAGLAFVFLLEFFNSGIRRPADLTARLGITPIATLPYLPTRREVWLRRFKILFILGVFIVLVPAILLGVHFFYMPLDQLINSVLQNMRGAALATASVFA